MSLVSSLSDKVREGQLIVVDALGLETPKTAAMVEVLKALEAGEKAILVADGADDAVLRSARNISNLRMLPAALLNTLDLVKHRKVVMTLDAVRKAEQLWGELSDRRAGRRSAGAAEAQAS
jgi:large subunit ribosomal protein L4